MKMPLEKAKAYLSALEKTWVENEKDEDWLDAEGMNVGAEMIAYRTAIMEGPDKEGNVEVPQAR